MSKHLITILHLGILLSASSVCLCNAILSDDHNFVGVSGEDREGIINVSPKPNLIASQKRCGSIPERHSPTGYIAGGYNASKGDFPPYVRIDYFGKIICGGTLISDKYVLTAAHCLKGILVAGLKITPTYTIRNTPGDKSYRASEYCRAREYTKDFDDNDVGIIKLERAVIMNRYVQPACLPDSPINPDRQAYAVGLGITKTNTDFFASKLQVLPVKYVECDKKEVGKTKLCFLSNKVAYVGDTCRGDSGGPIFQMMHGRLTVVGSTSYGPDECESGVSGKSVNSYIYKLLPNIKKLKECVDFKLRH